MNRVLAVNWLNIFFVGVLGIMGTQNAEAEGKVVAVIETNRGTIEAELFADKVPLTAANFINLANRGYYDGISFHRVIEDFMVQTGDPEGSGRGGPGYKFEDEFNSSLKHAVPGVLSMANSGPGTNGSQFFITHVPTPWLDGKHSVFGQVISGQDVVNAIKQGDKMTKVTIKGDTSSVLEKMKDRVSGWNKTLDTKFPKK